VVILFSRFSESGAARHEHDLAPGFDHNASGVIACS
jgi:hypothetical protein